LAITPAPVRRQLSAKPIKLPFIANLAKRSAEYNKENFRRKGFFVFFHKINNKSGFIGENGVIVRAEKRF
jgi:hypothetical protein